ncbi:hypothetical protein EYC80_000613 [Monilinia laxa]|uniref:Apple domain-containing protein n=1 Tax=Monilinia laxa TaxID=61186 RepID=A0A5N6KBD6_MONLA|nr:hypothetical protein EYC80_000613 [Monilinia laxa]
MNRIGIYFEVMQSAPRYIEEQDIENMTRLISSFILLTITSLAISSPLNSHGGVVARNAAPQDPSPPTTGNPTTTTTTSSVIATKTIAGCNVQGTADVALTSRVFGTTTLPDFLSCQSRCRGITACISYSFSPNSTVCTYYNSWMDDFNTGDTTGYVILSNSSGIFFSDKYPSDGSDFCYSVV